MTRRGSAHRWRGDETELQNLRRWKAEATEVLAGWERVWIALGSPGPLGASKAAACEAEVNRLRAQAAANDAD